MKHCLQYLQPLRNYQSNGFKIGEFKIETNSKKRKINASLSCPLNSSHFFCLTDHCILYDVKSSSNTPS